jgi:N-acetylmuramoyl-L-alanine amidase
MSHAPRLPRRGFIGHLAAAWLALGLPKGAWASVVRAVRVWPAALYTRVTIESDAVLTVTHQRLGNPERLVIDIEGLDLSPQLRELVSKVQPDDPFIAGVRVGQFQPRVVRMVLDLKQGVSPQLFSLAPVANYQHRLVFDLHPTVEQDPLLQFLQEKLQAEAKAQRQVDDALGDFIGRVGHRGGSPTGTAPAAAPVAAPVVAPVAVHGRHHPWVNSGTQRTEPAGPATLGAPDRGGH